MVLVPVSEPTLNRSIPSPASRCPPSTENLPNFMEMVLRASKVLLMISLKTTICECDSMRWLCR